MSLLKSSSAQLRLMDALHFENALRKMSADEVVNFVRLRDLQSDKLKICQRYAREMGFDLKPPTALEILLRRLRQVLAIAGWAGAGLALCGLVAYGVMEHRARAAADLARRMIDIPGGSAWAYLGRWSNEAGAFAEGPYAAVRGEPDPARRFPFAAGDTLEIRTPRPLYIIDFALTETAKAGHSPVGKWRMEPADAVGLTALPEVPFRIEELSIGRSRERPGWDVWVRIARVGQELRNGTALALEKSGR
ncbi:MAG TPA: hypothetical protein VEH84_09135 [Alphaproteobacteria bacterium]|nr:hypothetical protein [Alphaproteobacteria bacterium]